MATRFLPTKGFHAWTLLTVAVGVVLIWWGAAVTTEDVGLAVPDWPLAFGKLNPEGWMTVPALLLEHGHRWLGATIGLLVLVLYFWVFAKEQPRFIEAAGIVLVSLGYFYLVYSGALEVAAVIVVLGLLWLVLTWRAARWSLLRGLGTLALALVVIQASLGGLRVLQMSDPFGVVHGTLGQVFFCVLVTLAFVSSPTWRSGVPLVVRGAEGRARWFSTLLFGAVFMQLVIGAILRHTQREHLAASDILTTQGQWLPAVGATDVFVLFLHKYWGFTVAVLVLLAARGARSWVEPSTPVRWVGKLLSVLPWIQVGLGILVIWTGKSFWVTNFHVLNGLTLLALVCMLMAASWSGRRLQKAAEPGQLRPETVPDRGSRVV